jgi:predicted RNase H-like nuclease
VPPPLPYTVIAGVVPAARGWLALPGRYHGSSLLAEEPEHHADLLSVLDRRPSFATVVLHAPIGLADEPCGGDRPCDVAARQALGWPRRVAVERVPSRPALLAPTYDEARAIEPWLTRRQWHRLWWARDVMTSLQPYHQRRVYSGHPELTFRLLNEDRPLRTSPWWPEGQAERIALIGSRVPGLADLVADPPPGVRPDRLVDAAAMLWSARRLGARVMARLPESPTWDAAGIRTELIR